MAFLLAGASVGTLMKVATAIDFLQSYNGIEQDMFILWKTIESIERPLQTAEELMVRHEALTTLEPSVFLLKFLVGKVEEILEKDRDEADERPDSKEGWTSWLKHKKDGKERKEQLLELLPKLNGAIGALNMALNSLAVQPAVIARVQPEMPVYFVPDAISKARHVCSEIVFGRIKGAIPLCAGVLWENESVGGKSCLTSCQGPCLVELVKEGSALKLNIKSNDGEEESEPWEISESITSKTPAFSRFRKRDGKKLGMDSEDLCEFVYRIGNSYLEFKVLKGVSAEMFEAIIAICKITNGLSDQIPDENYDAMMKKAGVPFDITGGAGIGDIISNLQALQLKGAN